MCPLNDTEHAPNRLLGRQICRSKRPFGPRSGPHRREEQHLAQAAGPRSASSPAGRSRGRRRRSAASPVRAPRRKPRRRAAPPRRRGRSSAACCSKRRRCSSGSFSSLKELAISTPPTKASQRSTRPVLGAMGLGERRQLDRVVEDEGRLDQLRLDLAWRAGRRPACPSPRRGRARCPSPPPAPRGSGARRCRSRCARGSPRAGSPAARAARSRSPPRRARTLVVPSTRSATSATSSSRSCAVFS